MYDSLGDQRSYSYQLPSFNEVDNEKVLKMLQNQDLMMPSERQKEHQELKKGIQEWKRARAELFEYKKKKRVVERVHRSGITGRSTPHRSAAPKSRCSGSRSTRRITPSGS